MFSHDINKVLGLLYALIVLFLFAIYAQSDLISQPEALSTLETMNYVTAGSGSFTTMQGVAFNGDSFWILIASVSAFFGIAWFFSRAE